jgi:hypothetical protein
MKEEKIQDCKYHYSNAIPENKCNMADNLFHNCDGYECYFKDLIKVNMKEKIKDKMVEIILKDISGHQKIMCLETQQTPQELYAMFEQQAIEDIEKSEQKNTAHPKG